MAKEKEQQALEVKGKDPEITGGEEEEEEEEEPEVTGRPTPQSLQERLTRVEKRANRYKDAKREAAETKEKLAAEQRRADMAELKASQFETYARGVQAVMGPQNQGPDPLDEKIKEVEKNKQRLREAYWARRQALPANQDLSAEEQNKFIQEMQELEDKRADLRYEKRTKGSGKPVSQQDVQQTADAAAAGAALRAKYPDVLGNPQMATYTAHIYNAKLAMGLQGDQALEESVNETRRAFKVNATPSANERAKFGGPPSGMANGEQRNGSKVSVADMTDSQKRMAKSMYKNLDKEQAYKKWAKEVGSLELNEGGE